MVSLYQFNDKEICKELLLNQSISLLYRFESFEVDSKIIAILDISNYGISSGNSLIIHEEFGVFFDIRTTKELINEFYKLNGIGFAMSKAIYDLFNFRHYMPFVFAYVSYMPMTGGSRNSSDWVGLHYIETYYQDNKSAYFTTVHGYKIKLNFPHGNLENRIHDVCMISEKSVSLCKVLLQGGMMDLNPPSSTGMVRKHENCKCNKHQSLIQNTLKVDETTDRIIDYILIHLEIENLEAKELMKLYRYNLNKLKRLH